MPVYKWEISASLRYKKSVKQLKIIANRVVKMKKREKKS